MENILNEKDLNQAEMEETTADEMLRTEELEDMALDDAVDQEDPETAPVEGQIDKEEEILNHGEGNHSGRTNGPPADEGPEAAGADVAARTADQAQCPGRSDRKG